jgi:hypothetical protein
MGERHAPFATYQSLEPRKASVARAPRSSHSDAAGSATRMIPTANLPAVIGQGELLCAEWPSDG